MKTIAQQLNWDFDANGNLEIKDKNGNVIYWEDSRYMWKKHEYNSQGKEMYAEYSNGFSYKHEYDSEDNKTYIEFSSGYWERKKYDSKRNLIYLENSQDGIVIDRQPQSHKTQDQ